MAEVSTTTAGRCVTSRKRGEHGVPVKRWHVQVEQQHVRAGGGDDVHRLPAVSGLADDLDVWFLAEQVAQPLPDNAVVVGDHHADRHGTGTQTMIAAPHPGALSMSTVPPSSATRSRMCASPEPGLRGGRVEAVAGVAHGQLDVPVLAGHRHGQAARVAVPDGVGARLLGDAQQCELDGRGYDDVVQGWRRR